MIDMPADKGAALRRRYLTLVTQSLHRSSTNPLPGPPAVDNDLAAPWRARA